MTLDEYRHHLDAIDNAIAGLLDERFRVVERIGDLKRRESLPYYDPERERVVLARVAERVGRPDLIREVFQQIIGISRRYQARDDEDPA